MEKLSLGLTATLFSLASSLAIAAPEDCSSNFSVEGSFFKGKVYKTSAELPAIKPEAAFRKAYIYTSANGFTISSADKEMGVISASQGVSYGQGKSVPLNIQIEPVGSGSKISMLYSTSGGVSSPDDAVKKHFCSTIAEAAKG
ncbi:hypothetical protein LRS11_03565 [Pseudomonas sp. J452]|uniref:hypothetical protein n=1 Tax=Pseudomonas sp. J452 TaxID=2898441 RepID=UPI0021AD83EF|nr:hypothetical protein [Pseudomonas sp. J452]UUY09127.1 hypothetical protein LRS11_03565 [Pseudomonas sp. J452]